MTVEIFHSRHLAHWLAETRDHKMPQYPIADMIETDGVINLVKNQLRVVKQYGVNVGKHGFGSLEFSASPFQTFKIQFLYAEMRFNPFASLKTQALCLFLIT